MKNPMTTNEEHFPQILTVDPHAHFLPGIDDGAQSVRDAENLLRTSFKQGIRHMWATPHFYPRWDDPASFLARRAEAVERLKAVWDPTGMPSVYLGAEVEFFPSLCTGRALTDLTVGGSKYLLLEMPAHEWSDTDVEELMKLRYFLGLRVIIAHFERVVKFQSGRVIRRLVSEGILFQSNAHFIGRAENKYRVRSLLRHDTLDLIGSDCHNPVDRPPNLYDALPTFAAEVGMDTVRSLQDRALEITMTAEPCLSSAEA